MSVYRHLEAAIVQINKPVKDEHNRYQDSYTEDHMSEVAIYSLSGGIMINMNLLVHESTHQGLSPDKSIKRGMRLICRDHAYYVDDADDSGRLNQLALKRIEGLNERQY